MYTLSDWPPPANKLTAEQLELEIALLHLDLIRAPRPEIKRAAFTAMVELIRARSPERVHQMERERGLRLQ